MRSRGCAMPGQLWSMCTLIASLLVAGPATPPAGAVQAAAPVAQTAPAATVSAAPERVQALKAARETMLAARHCTLVTLGSDGHPQARIVDPFPPDDDFAIWIATNPRTRKITEIGADPRVTLLCFHAAGPDYVTLLGRAEVVHDAAEKAKRWKDDWAAFYKDKNRGPDYTLIRMRPTRIELVSQTHGLLNDPATWRPLTIALP